MFHLDIKKLDRFARWAQRPPANGKAAAMKAPDGTSFTSPSTIPAALPLQREVAGEKRRSAISFLKAAPALYQRLGVKVERVMMNNGSCYKHLALRRLCK